MRFVDVIARKRDGHALSREEIGLFVDGVTSGAVPEYQASALLMAIAVNGMSAGETSLLEETEAGGYFVVQVEKVTPPQLKPVEEVRDELVKAWQAERRREIARERAEALRAQLADGAPMAELLADTGFASKPIEPVQREAAGTEQGINRAVVQALFVQGNAESMVAIARKETDLEARKDLVQKLSLMKSKVATDYLMEILGK